jgi:hypothetical protein
MDKKYFSVDYIENQEAIVKANAEQCCGKGRDGFADYGLKGVELLAQAFQLWEPDELMPNGMHKNFKNGFRSNAFLHYYRIIFSFKATYNLLITGYYTEASILLRSIVETFVKLKYVEMSNNEQELFTSIAGHHGFEGKKFKVQYKDQFNKIAPDLYDSYKDLCDMAH